MAIRFRKSIKLAPGIRWNLSGSGSSWTLGPRGASIGIGKRGVFLNSGIPGTGLSSRSALFRTPRAKPRRAASPTTFLSLTCGVRDDGTLYFVDESGATMPDVVADIAKKQNREAILGLIQGKCDEINGQINALGRVHGDTPDPRVRPRFTATPFGEPKPDSPIPQKLGLLGRLLSSRRRRVEDANRAADEEYREAVAEWESAKASFDQQLAKRKALVETLIYEDTSAMEQFLEERLQEIIWPRETLVAFEIGERGRVVRLDVDLPEVEDMPTKLAAMPARGLKLSVKEMSATKVQHLYASHIHGVVFRLVGEVFASLPTAQEVIASGYSQRRDPATAQLREDYLLSVRVTRPAWEAIDFDHLETLVVVRALDRFDLRRDLLMTGVLRPITPHS